MEKCFKVGVLNEQAAALPGAEQGARQLLDSSELREAITAARNYTSALVRSLEVASQQQRNLIGAILQLQEQLERATKGLIGTNLVELRQGLTAANSYASVVTRLIKELELIAAPDHSHQIHVQLTRATRIVNGLFD